MALEITDFHARTALEDVDTIEICPAYPDLMVFGTYSLVGREREYEAQVRKGTIEVIPVSSVFQQAYPGMLLPKLAKRDFSAAVLDIHFHPEDKTLLGVALSNGQIHFFRFLRRGDVLGRRIITELLPLGQSTIAGADADGVVPLVTQFFWLPCVQVVGRRDVSNTLSVSLAATLSSHGVRIAKIRIPGIKSTNDPRLSRSAAELSTNSGDIHSHDLEAWTVASLPILNFDGSFQHILFSGGDDSRLIASMISQDNCKTGSISTLLTSAPTLLFSDRKTHSAGVTSILPLPLPNYPNTQNPQPTPLLTGSYDESIYLHLLNPHTRRPSLVTSLPLRGGVWRLRLMDTYAIRLPTAHSGPPERLSDKHRQHQTHYLLLVSCMHAGVRILRVTHTPSSDASEDHAKEWQITIEAIFTKGHETLVYCCDFRKEWLEEPEIQKSGLLNGHAGKDDKDELTSKSKNESMRVMGDLGKYTIVSTSFYDRQICVWGWRDGVRKKGRSSS